MDTKSVSIKAENDYRFAQSTQADIELLHTWFKNPRERISWGGPNMKDGAKSAAFADLLKQHGFQSFSLYQNDKLVGFAQIQKHSGKHCHIGRLAIHPRHRGLGLSHTLLDFIFKTVKKKFRSNTVSLFVYFSNTFAHHTYMKNGFVSASVPKGMVLMAGCDYMLKRL